MTLTDNLFCLKKDISLPLFLRNLLGADYFDSSEIQKFLESNKETNFFIKDEFFKGKELLEKLDQEFNKQLNPLWSKFTEINKNPIALEIDNKFYVCAQEDIEFLKIKLLEAIPLLSEKYPDILECTSLKFKLGSELKTADTMMEACALLLDDLQTLKEKPSQIKIDWVDSFVEIKWV